MLNNINFSTMRVIQGFNSNVNFKGYTKRILTEDEDYDLRLQFMNMTDQEPLVKIQDFNSIFLEGSHKKPILYEFFDDDKGNHASQYQNLQLQNSRPLLEKFVHELDPKDKINAAKKI